LLEHPAPSRPRIYLTYTEHLPPSSPFPVFFRSPRTKSKVRAGFAVGVGRGDSLDALLLRKTQSQGSFGLTHLLYPLTRPATRRRSYAGTRFCGGLGNNEHANAPRPQFSARPCVTSCSAINTKNASVCVAPTGARHSTCACLPEVDTAGYTPVAAPRLSCRAAILAGAPGH